jgi:GTP-binding protein HflX
LKAPDLRVLERLYRRKLPTETVFTPELANELCRISWVAGIQIGIILDRFGEVQYVIAGSATGLIIPPLDRRRTHQGRLQGLRLIHTHLGDGNLSAEDLTDLSRLRLDMIYSIEVLDGGRPGFAFGAHLFPDSSMRLEWKLLEPARTDRIALEFDTFISELEADIGRIRPARKIESGDRAILVATGNDPEDIEIRVEELKDLAASAGIAVLDTVIQRRPKPDPKYIVGKGKLNDIYIKALAADANLIVFDHEISPSQSRSISEAIDIRVLDRTQVILDIFAKRARTMEGKIQVELAQLKYNMPRLVGKNPALSRLLGGIGIRGPGESKLEIDRRRAKERMGRLEKEAKRISEKRALTRRRRQEKNLPVISIIGYTNTGKSTLLNTLTKSNVLVADMPFATLDPSSKRLRFPKDIEVIITDTVGFIRDLPADLKAAFMATLEELNDADLLLEVIDISDPFINYRMQAVNVILGGLELEAKPRLKVFNKIDKADREYIEIMTRRYDGVAISALDRSTLRPLIERLERHFL